PTILLLLSFWLFVLARLISGLFSAYHGSSPYRRAMGVSHPAFSRSRVYGIATHAGAVHPSFSWPALFISLGATGRSSHATGLAAKAWLPKRLGLHAAGRFG